jgi:hypothetical protein
MIDGGAQTIDKKLKKYKRTCCNNENNGPCPATLLMITGGLSIIGVLRNKYTADEQNAMSPPCGVLDALCYPTGAFRLRSSNNA